MSVAYPKIAVLLAAYNGLPWIKEQVESILAQMDVDVTIHVSVDPSNDGTESWCAELAATEPRFVLLPSAGRFGGAAPNFFRLIKDVDFDGFDFIAFSDQDDIWLADKLAKAIRVLLDKSVDAYSSNVTAFWPNGKTLLLNKAQPQVAWDYLFESAGPGCTYVFSQKLAVVMKDSILRRWDSLQQISLHDWFCYAFARSHGYRWFIDPSPGLLYRQHEHNQFGANTGIAALVARYKAIMDGWWFTQVYSIACIVGVGDSTFVKSWKKLGRYELLRLSLSANNCRRRRRDKLFFAVVCLVAVFTGCRSK